jgi:hypothetical protein
MAATLVAEPDFADSRQLRIYVNATRRALHRAAMELHFAAAELEAALMTIPAPPDAGLMPRSVQRRRARRVSRHMKHAAECMVAGSAAVVRTWGVFRSEFAPELNPTARPRRQAFKVVPD